MSTDIDPSTLPKPTKRDMEQLDRDIAYFEKQSRGAKNDRLALVAFGIAAGLKMSKSE